MLTIHSGTPEQPILEATNCRIQSAFPALQSEIRIHSQDSLGIPTQFSKCIISISLSHHLVRMGSAHDHDLRPSAHPYRITDNCHLIPCPAQNLHQPQEG